MQKGEKIKVIFLCKIKVFFYVQERLFSHVQERLFCSLLQESLFFPFTKIFQCLTTFRLKMDFPAVSKVLELEYQFSIFEYIPNIRPIFEHIPIYSNIRRIIFKFSNNNLTASRCIFTRKFFGGFLKWFGVHFADKSRFWNRQKIRSHFHEKIENLVENFHFKQ